MPEDSITITVSDKANIEWIRSKVRDGQFVFETEAVDQSIARLREDEAELKAWIKDEVADRYDELKLHPERAVLIEQVVANLEERRRRRAEQAE